MRTNNCTARVIPFQQPKEGNAKDYRKTGLNRNKFGSVRKVNNTVYVDFIYLGERVRESSGLKWTKNNARAVRQFLDSVHSEIDNGTFRFAHKYPKSKKAKYFTELESSLPGRTKTPEQVLFIDFALKWIETRRRSERGSGRTLLSYKSQLTNYLTPFFKGKSFAYINKITLEELLVFIKERQLRGKIVSNATANKCFIPLKMICNDAAIKYGWGSTYNPFFGFKKLDEKGQKKEIEPFSLTEQNQIIDTLDDHWKPFFRFAFCSGIRQGEQRAIKAEDIDWENRLLHIRHAMTFDEDGKTIEGNTKNEYSQRTIKLIPAMYEALVNQKRLYDQFDDCKYFFCNPSGQQIFPYNLSHVWKGALIEAGVKYRQMRQTRHSFATVALSLRENPLWIAKVLGHRNTDMVINIYSSYLKNAGQSDDGALFNEAQGGKGKNKE